MERRIRLTLLVLALLLAVLLVVLFFQYRALERQQLIGLHQLRAALFLEHHAPLPPTDASSIRPWMTFDYINKLFALPPEYLRIELHIATSSGYPRLTVSNYAKMNQMDANAFLLQLESVIRSATSSIPTAAPAIASGTHL